MSLLSAILCASALALLAGGTSRRVVARQRVPVDDTDRRESTGRWRLIVVAGCICAGLVVRMDGWGLCLGVIAAIATHWLLERAQEGRDENEERLLAAQAPVVADLLAACVSAGVPLTAAAQAVAEVTQPPAGPRLAAAAAHSALGSPPEEAWRDVASDPQLGPVGRAIVRSLQTGSGLADSLAQSAGELRAARSSQVEMLARAVGVKAVGPLGLCFLPAFLLLGVVPIVASLLTRTLGGL